MLISQLEKRAADIQARLPVHSIPPNLIAELDEIDDQIKEAKSQLAVMNEENKRQ